ncbi:B9 domain-containing protein 1 [Boothiomyces sp. JEL0838]|nr:B9 domain-containing protein 1 [Boothiomyces sp. JEL0838]
MSNIFSVISQYDNMYVKFGFDYGPDWSLLHGLEEGISQLARQAEPSSFTTFDQVAPCVWNFPLDLAFKSTNVYGWPTLIVTVYGFDFLGRDVVRGYGALRLPTTSGKYLKLN